VIITACGEDPDLILDTVRAACIIDYPRSRFRIVLADDGTDERLRSAVHILRQTYCNVFYYSRIKRKDIHHGFKAGNLNSTIRHTSQLDGGHSEWVAVLDCDMIPERDWLRALLAHAANQSDVAMAVPPQVGVDTRRIRALWLTFHSVSTTSRSMIRSFRLFRSNTMTTNCEILSVELGTAAQASSCGEPRSRR